MRRRGVVLWLLVALAAAGIVAVSAAIAAPADDVIAITGGPSGSTSARDATFTFGPAGRTQYDYATCDLDGTGDVPCSSPVTYSGLGLGDHRFLVRAYSSRGGLLGSDARSWTVVDEPPPPPPRPPEPPPPPPTPPPPIMPGPVPVLPDFFLTAAPYGGQNSLKKPVKPIVIRPGQAGAVAIAVARIGASKGPMSLVLTQLPQGVTSGLAQDVVANPSIVTVTLYASKSAKPAQGAVTLTATPSSPAVGPAPRSIQISYLIVEEYDLAVAGIDVTQGIQLPQSQASALPARSSTNPSAPVPYPGAVKVEITGGFGNLSILPLAGAAPLVQGKKTRVRVFGVVAGPKGVSVSGVTMLLHGRTKNGATLPLSPLTGGNGTVPPPPPPGGTAPAQKGTTLGSGDPNAVPLSSVKTGKGAFHFFLPSSWTKHASIELEAELVPPVHYGKAECSLPACLVNNRFRLTNIPFHGTGFLEVWALGFTGGDGKLMSPWGVFQSTARALPIDEDEFRVDEEYRAYYAAESISGQESLLAAVKEFAGDLSACNTLLPIRPAGCPDIVAGVRSDGINGISAGGADAYPPGPGKIVVNQARPLTSAAHEVGHSLRLKHADTACGGDDDDQVSEVWWPEPWGLLYGITAEGKVNGTGNVGTVGVNTDASWYDLMSYCAGGAPDRAWLSLVNYRRTFDVLRALQKFRFPAASARTTQQASGAVLSVVGYVDGDNVILTRVRPKAGIQAIGNTASTYRLALRNAVGTPLVDVPMVVEQSSGHGGDAVLVSADVALPGTAAGSLPQAAYALEILRDEELAARVLRSPSSPSVELISPRAGQRVGGSRPVVVQWVARDPDGDSLRSAVDFSVDDGRTWSQLFARLVASRVSVPSGLLARSARARLRIRVTDGFEEASAVSARFVSLGTAPRVRITESRRMLALGSGGVLSLSAVARDDARRSLRGRALAWFDGARRVGSGETLELGQLPPGRHRIRVEARDRLGRRASDTVLVDVTAVAPRLVIRAAPSRLSPRARTVRLVLAATSQATVVARGASTVGAPAWRIGPQTRIVNVPIRPGAGSARIVLRATAFDRSSTITLTIARGR